MTIPSWGARGSAAYPALSCAAAFAVTARHLVERMDWGRYLENARQHGLGMLQGELSEELRVHVWHPALRTPKMAESYRNVHDHRFDLLSAVVSAHEEDPLVDVSFDVGKMLEPMEMSGWEPDGSRTMTRRNPPPGHVACSWIRHAKIQSDSDAADSILLGYVKPRLTSTRRFVAGDVYSVLRGCFHTTLVTGPVLTVVHRSNFGTAPARVLGPVDQQTGSAIVKDPDHGLWDRCLAEALAVLRAMPAPQGDPRG